MTRDGQGLGFSLHHVEPLPGHLHAGTLQAASPGRYQVHIKAGSRLSPSRQPDAWVHAGTVFWAVAYASVSAQYGPWEVGYTITAPSPADIMAASPVVFQGAFAAGGNFSVQGASVLNSDLDPPCISEGLCAKSLHALAAGTQYWVSRGPPYGVCFWSR